MPKLGLGGQDKNYFNHVKGRTVDQRSKVARFEQPIVAVKHVSTNPATGAKPYTLIVVFSPQGAPTYLA